VKDDAVKELIVGGAAVTATIADPHTALPVVLTGVAALFATAWERINSRNARNAERVFEQLVGADTVDDLSVALHKALLEEKPEVLAAVRNLLESAVEAQTDTVLGAMAVLARRHLRGECPAWVSRGCVRMLAEVTEEELSVVRELVDLARDMPQYGGGLFSLLMTDGQVTDCLAAFYNGSAIARTRGTAQRVVALFRRHERRRKVARRSRRPGWRGASGRGRARVRGRSHPRHRSPSDRSSPTRSQSRRAMA